MSGLALSLALIALTGPADAAWAEGVPFLTGIFPPGATVGRVTEWAIAGANFSDRDRPVLSGEGVEVLGFTVKNAISATARVRVLPGTSPGDREVRIDGPSGVSNLAVIRVDLLEQGVEVEPNDQPGQAQSIEVGDAVAGSLRPLDFDHYRVRGKPGQRVTLDLETARLGTAIAPVLTVVDTSGRAIAQARRARGGDGECRTSIVLPPDATCIVLVRDNTYAGDDRALYRLRVDPAPFATSLFPLGGPKGQSLAFEVSGGSLASPLRRMIRLPDRAGTPFDPGPFALPEGLVACPGRLVAGDGPEVVEPQGEGLRPPMQVPRGTTVNGRIEQPGEVDSYRIEAKAGETIQARVEARSLGSWLDPVLTIRDERGTSLVESDDSSGGSFAYRVAVAGSLTIELSDRFDDGGPAYGYRLALGPPPADFSVSLLAAGGRPAGRVVSAGVYNAAPGSSIALDFTLESWGRPGPIEVRVEGLPPGVTAEPVSVRPPPPRPDHREADRARATSDYLVLKIAKEARPGLSEFRIVATTMGPGPPILREAGATVPIAGFAVSGPPVTKLISRFPLRITSGDGPAGGRQCRP